jgi:hypothetical protein
MMRLFDNSRLEPGSSSIQQEEAEDVEEQPLVRHRSRRMSSGSLDSAKGVEVVEASSPPSSPGRHVIGNHPQHSENAFPDEVSYLCNISSHLNFDFQLINFSY